MNHRSTHRDEERIFSEALLLSNAQRASFLLTASGGDVALRQRLEDLLNEHEQTKNALGLIRKGLIRKGQPVACCK